MTWSDIIAALGIGIPASVALYLGVRNARSSEGSGLAAQVAALGTRLDETNKRLDDSEAREGRLIRYVYVLQRVLNQNGIDVPEPPNGLDL